MQSKGEPPDEQTDSFTKGAFSMDIEVKQLSVTFPSSTGAVRVLRDVNLLFHGGGNHCVGWRVGEREIDLGHGHHASSSGKCTNDRKHFL